MALLPQRSHHRLYQSTVAKPQLPTRHNPAHRSLSDQSDCVDGATQRCDCSTAMFSRPLATHKAVKSKKVFCIMSYLQVSHIRRTYKRQSPISSANYRLLHARALFGDCHLGHPQGSDGRPLSMSAKVGGCHQRSG